ncbi:MAG: DUF6588 family protein [Bacteroidales bacterium]
MNNLRFKRLSLFIISASLFFTTTYAQIDNVEFIKAGAADGLKLMEAYFKPWANAFGAGLNGSWYNTAKPHKLGGFDITASINIGMVPKSEGTFNLDDLDLTVLTGTGTASTISGPNTDGPTLTKTVSGVTVASFPAAPGTDWRLIPVPMAQVGIGLPLGTELKIRFMPKLTIQDGDLSLWGVGLVHSIMQYIPGNKMLPIDVSLFGGYTKLTGNIPISLQPDNYGYYPVSVTPATFADQNLNSTVQALNVSLIASVSVPVVTFYGGLGYSKTQTKIVMEGNYPTPVAVATPTPHAEYNESGILSGAELPDIDIKNFSGLRANVGVRFKLAVITIHADYTRSLYNVFSAGLGISFR